ncbi:hypothetical protein [Nocardia sp. alder85J]|nr:hypothetical protein [Nocardia sp. alder85J]MCX4091837.1 hypothetical protein [Nocardia sp. alder85J]
MYAAVPHEDKELVPVRGGTHYLQGQPEHIGFVIDTLVTWLDKHELRP